MSFLDRIRGRGGKPRDAAADDDSRGSNPTLQNPAADPSSLSLDLDTSRMSAADSAISSIISESTPSELPGGPESGSGGKALAARGLPLIGALGQGAQQIVLATLLVTGLFGLAVVTLLALNAAGEGASRAAAASEVMLQSQRLARSASQAVVGEAGAFAELRDSAALLASTAGALRGSEAAVGAAAPKPLPEALMPLIEQADRNAGVVLSQQAPLTAAGKSLRAIRRQSGELLEAAEAFAAARLQQEATAAEVAAAGRLPMLTQRLGRVAGEMLALDGGGLAESASALERDVADFQSTAESLLAGHPDRRLPPLKDPAARQQLQSLLSQFEPTRTEVAAVLAGVPGLVKARQAQGRIAADGARFLSVLQGLHAEGHVGAGVGPVLLAAGGASVLLAVLGAVGLFLSFAQDQRRRALLAEGQREEAERLEQQAKRVNDANQAAILRLMNELQSVAEGDLTQQATVTEDITGAIADSVNYTVEELRSLVSQVQGTASRVTSTTQQVELTSTELLAASDEQLREIRETGESVLQMADRINQVSSQASRSAQVARQSLVAAESGLQAVQNAIGGMNTLRDQIQDTSKRIKRLGESSQEIGEITELISDITEQTNVLALNAAIQAASAGEAGRGFSVVAEEVQRLAERSADATRQIAALVKAIQTDTQDAVAAMERSTQGVVEGARLSDSAGAALGEIDRVSRQLADLIEGISSETSSEAQSANVVASNIQHIFAVTEQTGEGTRSTADLVRELSRTAEDLKASVARFKIR